jgi:uncharacterized protein (TIGR02284 family)
MSLETKLSLSDDTLKHLQELIQTNIDSSEGLVSAAERVDDHRVASTFREIAQERTNNARELQSYVTANAKEAQTEGSTIGAIHRGWTAMRAAINGGDPYVILIEAERGEDRIKEQYEDVLLHTAGSAVNDVLQRQFAGIVKGHDLIRDLRDVYKFK